MRNYIRNAQSNDVINKVRILTILSSSGPEIFFATTINIMLYPYDSLGDTLAHTKTSNVYNFLAVIIQTEWSIFGPNEVYLG